MSAKRKMVSILRFFHINHSVCGDQDYKSLVSTCSSMYCLSRFFHNVMIWEI